ncbi:MAG: hypothetical protein NC489_08000 [Ruminococcus flavefaciens]|nr:hypothetical protein [Ruminococcus flavefaciens]
MNIPDPLKLYRYQYRPGDVVLTIAGVDYEFRDGSVTYLNMIHQYVKRHLPVVQMGIEMETSLIQKLYDGIDDAKMTITIMERQLDEDEKIIGTSPYFKHTFSIIPSFEKGVYITSTDPEVLEQMEVMRQLQNFELFLVDLEAINWFDQEFSDHCVKVSHAGMLQKLFEVREIPKGIGYTTPPLIDDIIPDFVLPLGDLVTNIDHMNTEYGLYDCNPIIYYDFTNMYCISKVKPNIIAPSATDYGTITFILLNPEKPDHEISGSYDDAATKTHWMNLQVEPHISDTRTRDTSTKLSTLTSVNSKGEVNKTTLNDDATRLKYIYATNELTEQQLMNETMTGPTLSIRLPNVTVRPLKPYKDYTFEADTSYDNLDLNNHIFRILGWTLGIQREGAVEYLSEITAELYNPERE